MIRGRLRCTRKWRYRDGEVNEQDEAEQEQEEEFDVDRRGHGDGDGDGECDVFVDGSGHVTM